ncbi:MAG TPA: AAA family ATPase [Thermoanaerobaculia bacterium]|nr:AAA family ATPase [Thermoanaerobaculia bacterium]
MSDSAAALSKLRANVALAYRGEPRAVDLVLTALLSRGHVLIEDVPGVGKTTLARSLGRSLSLDFRRIQFTSDTLPADVLGISVFHAPTERFEFHPGPIFANIVLADEINRATPKTQSALLEGMQEQSVTVAKVTYPLDPPFFVLATQNPLEMEGTYPLPEAQLDRFFYKLKVGFPDRAQLHTIMDRTTRGDDPTVGRVVTRARILEMREVVRRVPVARTVQDFALRVLLATHPDAAEAAPITRKYVRYGASPRGGQALLLGAKVRALFAGRFAASCDDLRHVARPALRHRIILNFEGEAEGVGTDRIVDEILAMTPEEAPAR